uniref:Uncharacterized protein n=1 Tax=Anguilla anguilla TaxID=7936 RepID=A0A0E9XNZ5_ANGAN
MGKMAIGDLHGQKFLEHWTDVGSNVYLKLNAFIQLIVLWFLPLLSLLLCNISRTLFTICQFSFCGGRPI